MNVRKEKAEIEGNTESNYDRCEGRKQGSSVKSPDELYEEVRKVMLGGSQRDAISPLEMFLAIWLAYALAHNDLGILYFKVGKKEKASEH
jgi:hypothetical protein